MVRRNQHGPFRVTATDHTRNTRTVEHPWGSESLMLRSKRKPVSEPRPVVLGYINAARIPAGQNEIHVGAPMRARAAECGYTWGGTYLDRGTHGETVAALTRAANANPAVVAVIVPDDTHRPGGQQTITASTRQIRVVTTDTIDAAPSARTRLDEEAGRDG
ncbi:hypothetical protein [Nocardia nepalensis]|uniref:hypothetical protein n=1 Tax=Nocardia nepalensis TaxID=3375448 RepID=UPI003B67C42F